jgi:hypothetical protein
MEDCVVRLRVVDNIFVLFGEDLNFLSLVVTIRTISCNVNNSTFLPTVYLCVLQWRTVGEGLEGFNRPPPEIPKF